jgi:hypothetical protein
MNNLSIYHNGQIGAQGIGPGGISNGLPSLKKMGVRMFVKLRLVADNKIFVVNTDHIIMVTGPDRSDDINESEILVSSAPSVKATYVVKGSLDDLTRILNGDKK